MSKKSASKTKPYKWLGHIQVYFNDEEIADCLAWVGDRTPQPLDVVDTIVQSETATKISYSHIQDCYYISLQPKSKDSFYRGYTLGFKHVLLTRLLEISLYIHEVLMENGGIELPNSESVPDW